MDTAVAYTDPRIAEFLSLWHENGREHFTKSYPSLNYNDYAKTATDRGRKYIALDEGSTGVFLLEKGTGFVYRIKAYGVKGRLVMHLDQLIAEYREANANKRQHGAPFG